eukprot:TRINITY_DN9002_c0_g1_i1.p1 TRINITY_DN9002_c0_g1~~TRINITY_DN9002_c0_g1_i1.p1  ORF type:complete len:315 (-),score=54.17 TRINITY_DN9002_c0_g1_i1:250-1110(-)
MAMDATRPLPTLMGSRPSGHQRHVAIKPPLPAAARPQTSPTEVVRDASEAVERSLSKEGVERSLSKSSSQPQNVVHRISSSSSRSSSKSTAPPAVRERFYPHRAAGWLSRNIDVENPPAARSQNGSQRSASQPPPQKLTTRLTGPSRSTTRFLGKLSSWVRGDEVQLSPCHDNDQAVAQRRHAYAKEMRVLDKSFISFCRTPPCMFIKDFERFGHYCGFFDSKFNVADGHRVFYKVANGGRFIRVHQFHALLGLIALEKNMSEEAVHRLVEGSKEGMLWRASRTPS